MDNSTILHVSLGVFISIGMIVGAGVWSLVRLAWKAGGTLATISSKLVDQTQHNSACETKHEKARETITDHGERIAGLEARRPLTH